MSIPSVSFVTFVGWRDGHVRIALSGRVKRSQPMVGSADMTNKRALEPTMSMSLFKSPEYAQEVWLDLSCEGLSLQGFLMLAGQLSA